MEWKCKVASLYLCFVVQCAAMSLSELEDFSSFLKRTSQLDETLKMGSPHDFDEDEPISDHAWENSGKFEGDLILNERQRRMIVEDIAEGLSRNGLRDSTKRWPDNELVYYIQKEHFTEDQVQAINNGIEELAQASCLKFRPYRKGDRDAVVVQGNRRGCFSQVGYQSGYQVLNLNGRHPVGRGCFRHGTVVHEFLHALGFYHMQSSPDRDDYVDIAWENIVQPARHNFRKYNAFAVSDFGVGYDYDSVLHYSRRAFSANGQDTIVPKQGGAEIGQRLGLSDKDTQKLNKMYCDADSNNDGEVSNVQRTPVKKKKPTNKPFQGQGIGYHQGKTVVIKLLPDEKTETYQLPSDSEFHLFDHFSKPAKELPQKKIEDYGFRPVAVDSYEPYISNHDYYNEANTKLDTAKKADPPYNRVPEDSKSIVTKEKEQGNPNDESLGRPENGQSESSPVTDDLSDAFDRLTKIIKTHVYPSQTPDFSSYRTKVNYENVPKFLNQKEYSSNIKGTVENHDKPNNDAENNEKHEIDAPISNQNQDVPQNTKTHNKSTQEIKEADAEITPEIKETDAEISYRTSYPFNTHKHISNGSLEIKTPEYATYDHLKDKHNFSDFYHPNTDEERRETVKQHKIFGEYVPVYSDWYTKEEHNHNPANYGEELNNKENAKLIDKQVTPDGYGYEYPTSSGTRDYYTTSYSPQKKEAYLLLSVPAPLTKDWYRVDHQKFGKHYPYKYANLVENSFDNKR